MENWMKEWKKVNSHMGTFLKYWCAYKESPLISLISNQEKWASLSRTRGLQIMDGQTIRLVCVALANTNVGPKGPSSRGLVLYLDLFFLSLSITFVTASHFIALNLTKTFYVFGFNWFDWILINQNGFGLNECS